uniref:Uncharacterized protein n=1 Tax=Anguilla anguilla TaxID=7936 RepID=A0A0E9SQ34_ANGAN
MHCSLVVLNSRQTDSPLTLTDYMCTNLAFHLQANFMVGSNYMEIIVIN